MFYSLRIITFPNTLNLTGGRRKGATVLNIFSDRDYNRSVLTIVAGIELIGEILFLSFLSIKTIATPSCSTCDLKSTSFVH